MVVLDTNVISELMRQRPAAEVLAWINRQPPETVWTTTVSIFEVFHGIELHPDGKRQQALRGAFELALKDVFKNRILPFDFAAAAEAARIAPASQGRGTVLRNPRPADRRDRGDRGRHAGHPEYQGLRRSRRHDRESVGSSASLSAAPSPLLITLEGTTRCRLTD